EHQGGGEQEGEFFLHGRRLIFAGPVLVLRCRIARFFLICRRGYLVELKFRVDDLAWRLSLSPPTVATELLNAKKLKEKQDDHKTSNPASQTIISALLLLSELYSLRFFKQPIQDPHLVMQAATSGGVWRGRFR